MPSGVFKPYAGVATAVLIFTKGGSTEQVWFYKMESDGKSLDDKRNELFLPNGKRDFGDLHKIVTAFKAKHTHKENDPKKPYFFVSKKEIEENGYDLSPSKYKEGVYEEVIYEKPAVIFKKLEGLEKGIQKGLNKLKKMVV